MLYVRKGLGIFLKNCEKHVHVCKSIISDNYNVHVCTSDVTVEDLHVHTQVTCTCTCMYMYNGDCRTGVCMHVRTCACIISYETRQMQTTTPEDNSFFPEKKKSCLGRDSNPRCSAFQADALPAEPPRQLSWAGRIFKVYTRQMASFP